MEDNQPSRPHMLGKLFEHRRRILLECQDIAADDGVERLVERHLDGIALAKGYIAAPTRNCSRPRRRYSSRRSVHPDDRTSVTDNYGTTATRWPARAYNAARDGTPPP